MTTVLTPAGTPTVIYNRSGLTIDSITATGTVMASAAAIVRYTGHTVVLVSTPDSSNVGVVLPDDAEVGDVVEVHNIAPISQGMSVFVPSGQYMNDDLNGSRIHIVWGLYRLTAAGSWRPFAGG